MSLSLVGRLLIAPALLVASSATAPAWASSTLDIKTVANSCANCHGPDGRSTTIIPALAGRPEAALLVGDRPAEGPRAVRRAEVAVVEHDAPAGEIGAGGCDDLDRFTGVGAGVVVMDLVDEDLAVGRGICRCGGDRKRAQAQKAR